MRSGNEHEILRSISATKNRRVQTDATQLLKELWDGDESDFPDYDWKVLASERVRVELADAIAESIRKQRIEMDSEPIRQQLRHYAESTDPEVQRRALSSLGLFDDPDDIEILLRAISSEVEDIHRTALFSLAGMCNREAEIAFDRLLVTLPEERRSSLQAIRNEFARLKTKDSNWCECRDRECPDSAEK